MNVVGLTKKVVLRKAMASRLKALRPENTYYITGLRRSGNHAIIEWIRYGYDHDGGCFAYSEEIPWVGRSKSGRVVHLNDLNHRTNRELWRFLRMPWRQVDGSVKTLIVSTEDLSPQKPHWYIGYASYKLYVTRNLLDVIASRVRFMLNEALAGRQTRLMNLYSDFFKDWLQLKNMELDTSAFRIEYEQWSSDAEYRNRIGKELGFDGRMLPIGMSSKGGGSSFSAGDLDADSSVFKERYKNVSWHRDVVAKVMALDTDNNILTRKERVFLQHVIDQ